MSQVINTNILSLTAQRNLSQTGDQLATALERLSSGLRINSAADDAAGLAISERFTTQIRGLDQAVRNANDGISFAQTAEGALSTVSDNLQRIRELAVQASNDTNSAQDRQALNNEVQELVAEIGRVANSTEFNGQSILDGTLSDLTFQVGANQGQTIEVSGVDARTSQLGAATDTGTVIAQSDLGTGIADDLVINGASVDLSGIDGSSTTQDVVNAINQVSGDSDVFAAVADSTSVDLTYATDGTNARTLTLNNVTIDIAAGTSAADAAALVNDVSAQTGVTATESGGAITFSSQGSSIDLTEDGTNAVFSGPNAPGAGASETFLAGIELSTDIDGTFNVQGTDATDLGINAVTAQNNVLGDVNVLTREDSQSALQTLDFALSQVSGLRAELGATQTRFESTIDNLSVTTENLTAARSRILDADFAEETANLTRAQILQQAGTSVLAQANAAPQNVLSLLQ
jgi:flagellin